jgi:hypothetical protein
VAALRMTWHDDAIRSMAPYAAGLPCAKSIPTHQLGLWNMQSTSFICDKQLTDAEIATRCQRSEVCIGNILSGAAIPAT